MSPLQTTGGKDDPNIAFILNSIIKIKLWLRLQLNAEKDQKKKKQNQYAVCQEYL